MKYLSPKAARFEAYHVHQIAILIVVLFNLWILECATQQFDPYSILGVRKDASLDQIKKAYRDLARKLHPDKSNLNHDDGRKFIELNKAFDVLKDSSRRTKYDLYKQTDNPRQSRGYHQTNRNYHGGYANSEWVHGGASFTFTFTPKSHSYLKKRAISTKQYYEEYLNQSFKRPFLVFVYRDSCISCFMIENTWMKIVDDLARYNVGSLSINHDHNRKLMHDLGISSVPYISCLVDGQLHQYYNSEISIALLIRFIRNLLPNDSIVKLTSEIEQERFIALSPHSNKLCAIIVNTDSNLKLRYYIMAFELRQYYRFGHISTKTSQYATFLKKFNLGNDAHLLIFDERTSKPLRNIRITDQTDIAQLKSIMSKWPFLRLPRISSQSMFDSLCFHVIPFDGKSTKKRLCVILFAQSSPIHEKSRSRMIEFMELNKLERDESVVFAYIDPAKQKTFVQDLLSEAHGRLPSFVNDTIINNILLIERNSGHPKKAHFDWLKYRWDPDDLNELDRAKLQLYQKVISYKSNEYTPHLKIVLGEIDDEGAASLFSRVINRIINYISRTSQYLTSSDSFSTLFMLLGCAILTSLFLYKTPDTISRGPLPNAQQNLDSSMRYNLNDHLTQTEDHAWKSETDGMDCKKSSPKSFTIRQDMRILELKAETYDGMVRLLKPGYRSIVLLTDEESKDKLLPQFGKAVYPYRRNKTLLFAYLILDKNLDWYRSLLEQLLGCDRLNVNKRNCIGTVLSLNGFKRYLRVYHVKHHEIDYYDDETPNDGSFLGFDDDNNSDYNENGQTSSKSQFYDDMCAVDHLLDRLSIWLDKMFDGLTKRYSIDYWPDNMK